jgi:hypothetical protein
VKIKHTLQEKRLNKPFLYERYSDNIYGRFIQIPLARSSGLETEIQHRAPPAIHSNRIPAYSRAIFSIKPKKIFTVCSQKPSLDTVIHSQFWKKSWICIGYLCQPSVLNLLKDGIINCSAQKSETALLK